MKGLDGNTLSIIREKFINKFNLIFIESNKKSMDFLKFDAANQEIDLHQRIKLIGEVDRYFDKTNDITEFDSYEHFLSTSGVDKSKAHDNVRNLIPSFLIGKPERNTIIKVFFVAELSIEDCNQFLMASEMDQLYSRNINEAIMYYYIQKNENRAEMRSIDELFTEYYTYKKIVHKYNSKLSTLLGQEFSSVIASYDSPISGLNKYIKFIKNPRGPKLVVNNTENKSATLYDYICCLKNGMIKYEELTHEKSSDRKHSLTTSIVLEQIKDMQNFNDLENLIDNEQIVWCQNRNKPLKRLITLMNKIQNIKTLSFNNFAYELFKFYFIGIKEDTENPQISYKLVIRNTDYILTTFSGKPSKSEMQAVFNDLHIPREFSKILFGISPLSRRAYISIYIFLGDVIGSIPTVNDLNLALSECGYSVLRNTPSDKFIINWLENKDKSLKNMHEKLTFEFERNPDLFIGGNFPLSWK